LAGDPNIVDEYGFNEEDGPRYLEDDSYDSPDDEQPTIRN